MNFLNNKENKKMFKGYFGCIENSKKLGVQKTHLKKITQQKQSLNIKKPVLTISEPEKVFNELELKGSSFFRKKISLSVNKYTIPTIPASNYIIKSPNIKTGKTLHKMNYPKVYNVKQDRKQQTSSKDKSKNKILKFGEILNIFDMDDKNINVNEEVDNFIVKLEENKYKMEDFDTILTLDSYDVKSSNSFETLIDKLINFVLKSIANPISKEFKNYQKKIVCFIINGMEEFLFFDGISSKIFDNFTKLPLQSIECLEFSIVYLQRNSKKLYFLNEEKKEFMITLFIKSFFTVEMINLTEEKFFNILQIAENLIKSNHVRAYFHTNLQDFVKALVNKCANSIQKNTNLLLKKQQLMEINLFLICLKYPDYNENISREEFIFNLITKINNSFKVQREFPLVISFTFKKIRKVFTNLKLWEMKIFNFDTFYNNFNKLIKPLKGITLQEAMKTFKKMRASYTFMTRI